MRMVPLAPTLASLPAEAAVLMLKIDAQGADLDVLISAGDALSRVRRVLVEVLVERYDAVKFGIFQRNLSNFRGLVLFCIEADFCDQILIF